jgi:hypothetical protein
MYQVPVLARYRYLPRTTRQERVPAENGVKDCGQGLYYCSMRSTSAGNASYASKWGQILPPFCFKMRDESVSLDLTVEIKLRAVWFPVPGTVPGTRYGREKLVNSHHPPLPSIAESVGACTSWRLTKTCLHWLRVALVAGRSCSGARPQRFAAAAGRRCSWARLQRGAAAQRGGDAARLLGTAATGRGRSGAEMQRGVAAARRRCSGTRPQRGGDAAGRGRNAAESQRGAASSLSSPQLRPSLCNFSQQEGRIE